MIAASPTQGPIMASAAERATLVALARRLADGGHRVAVIDAEGDEVELPSSAAALLRQVVQMLARDRAVAIASYPRALSPHEAARLLGVPPARVVELMDRGELPSTDQGDVRSIDFDDLMVYKGRRDAERREALAELTRLGQEMGQYDERRDLRPGHTIP